MNYKITIEQKIIFLRQLSLVFDSDMMSSDGLALLKNNEKNSNLKEFYEKLENELIMGIPLSDSIVNTCDFFEEYELKLIELGETSGNISTVLKDMADGLEREAILDEKINSAFRYPSILAVLTLFILSIILSVIVPVYYGLIVSSGAKVSYLMSILNSLGLFLKSSYLYILSFIIIIFISLKLANKTVTGSKILKKYSLKRLLTRKIRLKASSIVFTKNLAMLIESGIDLMSTFEILEKAESNKKVKLEIQNANNIFKKNGDFSEAMDSFTLFPKIMHDMLSISIQTGHIVPSLKKIEQTMIISLDKSIERLISLVEPVITIIISIVVAVILLSGISPIFNMLNNII